MSFNLNNLLLATLPLALVSLGQATALLVGGFDVSVAALMTFCVVVASYTMTAGDVGRWSRRRRGARPRRRRARDRDLQRGAHPRVPACPRSSPRSGRSAPRREPCSSSAIIPRAHQTDVTGALTRRSASFRSPSPSLPCPPSSRTLVVPHARGLALAGGRLDETSSRRLGCRRPTVFVAFVGARRWRRWPASTSPPRFRSARR